MTACALDSVRCQTVCVVTILCMYAYCYVDTLIICISFKFSALPVYVMFIFTTDALRVIDFGLVIYASFW